MPCAKAQSSGKGMRVGWLGWTGAVGTSASPLALAAFRGGLADRGWTEGRDLEVVVRDGDRPRSGDLASELLKMDINVLVAQGPMAFGAKTVTGSKPLVFSINGDPVEAGLVASLSRPGGNLTGVTALSAELAGKRLELLKEAMRKGARVAVVANELHPGVALEREATHAAARRLGLTLVWYPLKAANDLAAAFEAIARDGADALLAIPDNLVNREARPIADFALARRLPSISGWSEFVEAGNLMSYGPNPGGYYRQMAFITDRILRGAPAADMAVEQPRDIEFVVSVKAARAIGLTLPPGLLLRADRQIV
jgi:putative ABC transport system substrate-binding protein